MRLAVFSLVALGSLATASHAVENPACTEAKDLVNVVQAFYDADPELTDILTPELSLTLTALNGFPDPDGLRFMHGEQTVDLVLNEDGKVQEIEKALSFHKDGKMCKLVNGQLIQDTEEDSTQASMNFLFVFNESSGEHTVDELLEGAKDGSKIMKSLAPGGLGFAVPGLKAIVLQPVGSDLPKPKLTFFKDGQEIDGPEISYVGKTQFFKTKALKRSKADMVKIDGDYILQANFNYEEEDLAEAEERRLAQLAEDAETLPK